MYQIGPPFGPRVGVTEGYMCTKFEVNSFTDYKTCHRLLMAELPTYFDLCHLEK